MRIPENWLRAWCDPSWSGEKLAERLTMAGLEVEERESFAPAFTGIVVGEIVSVEPHPNADRLRVCQVNVGSDVLNIVCGAANANAGNKVPCALPGAELPGGFAIKPVKMRGVQSNGMLCSSKELGVSEDHAGLLELPAEAPVGQDVREYLQLDEQVMTLKLTPNLAHCLSVYGVARELSAISATELKGIDTTPVAVEIDDVLPVTIEAPDLCGRFSGRVIRGIDATATTPAWMVDRLQRAGQRSITPLVDISNYVLLELGRPSHVFDLAKVSGGLTVRWAKQGENIELLNGQTISLDNDIGVISDQKGLESLAGIMGGQQSSVTDTTRDIFLEAAFWWPEAIAGRSRRLNFSTDAGHRFERGVDASTTVEHIEVITRLILSICGGKAGPVSDVIDDIPAVRTLSLRFDRARLVIGQPISDQKIIESLNRLGFDCARNDDGVSIQVPTYRFDLTIEEDLIEEVARLHGYDNLPLRAPVAASPMLPASEKRRSVLSVKRALASAGFQEVINYSFVSGEIDLMLSGQQSIALLNPIAKPLDVMRTTLWGGLIQTLKSNLNRKASRVRLFEAGRVFWEDAGVEAGPYEVAGISQPMRIAALAYGGANDEQWGVENRVVDFFDLKQDLQNLCGEFELSFEAANHPALHPGRAARVSLIDLSGDNESIELGWIGELGPKQQQELGLPSRVQLFELDLAPLLTRQVPVFEAVSRFPPSIRDIAVVVGSSVPASAIYSNIRETSDSNQDARYIQNIRLFDEYRGKGLENNEKSLAFRLWMQDTERTLEDNEVTLAVEAVVASLQDSFDARLR